MGACGSKPAGDPEEIARNKKIEEELANERKRLASEVKLLLLGAGESGKSTIAKQMKILHLKGFSDEERASFKSIIYNNTVSSMRVIIQASYDLNVPLDNADLAAKVVGEDYFDGTLTPEIAEDLHTLWSSDKGIKATFERSAEYQLTDSASYYFDRVKELGVSDWSPDDQDILRSRAKTTGIIETEFDIEKTHFRMVDVGGQRSERKKWMHCFQDVTAVIFCVALSEYDLKLYEDDTTNRMHESLKLFKEICNNRWFVETAMLLFLNKRDLFEEKVKNKPITIAFPDYSGNGSYKDTSEYIQGEFVKQNENPKKPIYPHITCATDTNNVQHVFDSVRDIILHKALDATGLAM